MVQTSRMRSVSFQRKGSRFTVGQKGGGGADLRLGEKAVKVVASRRGRRKNPVLFPGRSRRGEVEFLFGAANAS